MAKITESNPTGAGRNKGSGRPKGVKNIKISDNALFNKLTKAIDKLPQKAINELVKLDPSKYMNILERLQKQRPDSGDGGGTTMKYFFFPAKNLSDAKMKTHMMELYNLLEEKRIKFKKFTGDDE